MADALDQLRKTLKQSGFSLTLPRRLVFQALQTHGALSMKDLVRACLAIDRVSVYRTVALFERLGIAQRLQIGWKYQVELSDAFHHHHHLACLHCRQIIHFDEDKLLEKRLAAIGSEHGFLIQDHQLEIQGLCANCH